MDQVNVAGNLGLQSRAGFMNTVVDPYHEWLAIPPQEQPPNHYRLLGVPLFTDDPHVIAHAAHQRFTDIRSKQSDEHALLSQRIFDEIVAAEACLLNPETKAAYDANMRSQFPVVQQRSQAYVPLYLPLGKQRRQTLPPLPPIATPLPPVAPPVQDATRQSQRRTTWNYIDKRRGSPWKVAIGLAGLLVVVAIGLLVGHNSLPPAIQHISQQYLPPVLLAAIFALLSLYVGLLFPAGRRWIARRGRWGAALVGQAEYDAVRATPRDGPDAATFGQLVRETPVAFAILSAILIIVFVELLALMGTRGSTGPSTDVNSVVAEASSGESPASTNTEESSSDRFLPAEAATPVEDAPQLLSKEDPEPAEEVLSEKPDAVEETPLEQEDLKNDPPRVAMSDAADRFGQNDAADYSWEYHARRRPQSEGKQKTLAVGSRLPEQRTAIGWDTYWMAYIALVTFLMFVIVLVCRGSIR